MPCVEASRVHVDSPREPRILESKKSDGHLAQKKVNLPTPTYVCTNFHGASVLRVASTTWHTMSTIAPMLGSSDSSPAASQHGMALDTAADDVEGGGGGVATPTGGGGGGIDNIMLGFQNLSMSSVDPPKHIVANVSGFVVRGEMNVPNEWKLLRLGRLCRLAWGLKCKRLTSNPRAA